MHALEELAADPSVPWIRFKKKLKLIRGLGWYLASVLLYVPYTLLAKEYNVTVGIANGFAAIRVGLFVAGLAYRRPLARDEAVPAQPPRHDCFSEGILRHERELSRPLRHGERPCCHHPEYVERASIAADLSSGKAAVGVLAHVDEAAAVQAKLTELGGASSAHEIVDEAAVQAGAAEA